MRKLLVAALGIVAGLLLVVVPVLLLWPCAPRYYVGERNYRIVLEGRDVSLRADRIDRRDGCVLFYRQERIDTVLCETMGTLVVTEIYE